MEIFELWLIAFNRKTKKEHQIMTELKDSLKL